MWLTLWKILLYRFAWTLLGSRWSTPVRPLSSLSLLLKRSLLPHLPSGSHQLPFCPQWFHLFPSASCIWLCHLGSRVYDPHVTFDAQYFIPFDGCIEFHGTDVSPGLCLFTWWRTHIVSSLWLLEITDFANMHAQVSFVVAVLGSPLPPGSYSKPFYLVVCCWDGVLLILPGLAWNSWFCYFCPLSSWDYRLIPLCPAYGTSLLCGHMFSIL